MHDDCDDHDMTDLDRSYAARWLLGPEAVRRHKRLRLLLHTLGMAPSADELVQTPATNGIETNSWQVEADLAFSNKVAAAERDDERAVREMEGWR